MSPRFRRPRTDVFLVRPRGMGQAASGSDLIPAGGSDLVYRFGSTLPAMQSPLVQSGLYPVPLPVAAAPAPATPGGLSTPVLGLPVWFWAAAGGLVYWLFFSGGGLRGRGQ